MTSFSSILFSCHPKLRCHVVVELKTTPFRPEYAGQLNFYLSAIDAQVKSQDGQPTIGLLLRKEKNRLVAEYALRGPANGRRRRPVHARGTGIAGDRFAHH